MFYTMYTTGPILSLFALGSTESGVQNTENVGKCEPLSANASVFLSGVTQAAAVISTVIVGHHQRASITPARPWHCQQVPALPARLAPVWL